MLLLYHVIGHNASYPVSLSCIKSKRLPLRVKKHTTPVLPLLFLLSSNVEASYRRKANSPNGTWRKTRKQGAPGSRETCLLASIDRWGLKYSNGEAEPSCGGKKPHTLPCEMLSVEYWWELRCVCACVTVCAIHDFMGMRVKQGVKEVALLQYKAQLTYQCSAPQLR